MLTISFELADTIVKSPKTLVGSPRWETLGADGKHFRQSFVGRIALEKSLPRGVYLRTLVYPFPKDSMTFQLECDLPTAKSHLPLYRLEVKPIRRHINKPYGAPEINGALIDVGVTHEHIFSDSLNDDGTLREGQAASEQARIVENPPTDFTTALLHVCSRINILNGATVPTPGDQGILL